MAATEQQQIDYMKENSCFLWTTLSKIRLGAGEFSIKGHKYQHAMFEENHPNQVFIKGAQMGITEIQVLKTLHGSIHGRYKQGALYLFPTRDDVGDFSKARFAPLIDNNPESIGKFVKSTDSTNIKKIGDSFLYLRGARATKTIGEKKSSSQLKTIPVDRVVFDERDEITDEMVDLALVRMDHSEVQESVMLSTPTIPGYGIDKAYQESDQRVFVIKCRKCGGETCLEEEFPDCLWEAQNGDVLRLCMRCRDSQIYPRDGRWVARYPDQKDLVGWWISQLVSNYVSPKKILELFNNPPHGNMAEVMNSKLGMAYINSENRLTENDILACCSKDIMPTKHHGPCAMGVDVGKELHVTIGGKPSNGRLKIVKMARVGSFNDLYDLAKRFNVKCAVLDLYPETRKVKEFIKAVKFKAFGCAYSESQTVGWEETKQKNSKDIIISANRTEICDATHELVVNPGRLELPRQCPEVKEFAKEMCKIVKVLEKDEQTGIHKYRYRKIGADHFRHSTNYLLIAAEKIGIFKSKRVLGRIKQGYSTRKGASFMAA